jgi:exonuclease III
MIERMHGTGGGVALYVNSKIPFKIRKDLNDPSFECQWVTLRPKWLPRVISKIAVCCVYLPASQSEMDSFYDYLYNCYDKLCTERQTQLLLFRAILIQRVMAFNRVD